MWPKLLENVDFCNFFKVGLENASWRFGAFKGTKFWSKKWFGSSENRKGRKGLVTGRLGNSYFPKNGQTRSPSTHGGVPGRGVGGMDKSIPGWMASKKAKAMRLCSKKDPRPPIRWLVGLVVVVVVFAAVIVDVALIV